MSVSMITKESDKAVISLAKTICNEYFYQLSISSGNDDSQNYAMLVNMIIRPLQDPQILMRLLSEVEK